MRRVIVKEFEDLADALSNYNGMFVYRVKNFCVKADEVSLLPIKIMVEGELQNLDKCTIIAKKEEYNFMIFPKFDEDMPFLQQGIFEAHPEFKQKIETMKVETTDKNGNIKEVDANSAISYSQKYVTKEKSIIATIPIGYGDGIRRSLTNKGFVLINGVKAPIVGTICMDSFMVDITGINDVSVGDEVIIFDNKNITLDEIADMCETINYEILCNLNPRIPRLFI